MNAIGLNPIKLDAIGLDPIRMNAIRLGVPVASSGSARPYIDPDLLKHVKMAISTWGKSNDDPDRAVLKDLSGNGNDMRLLNFGFAEGSGYGLPGTDFEGWLCTDGVDDMIVSKKTVDEMIGDSKECTVISIINYISDIGSDHVNVLGKRFIRNNMFERNGLNGKYYICGYTSSSINEIGNVTVVNDILGDKNDFTASYPTATGVADYFSVIGYLDTNNVPRKCVKIAYAGGFIANKVLTTDEINQIIAYYNLDRPGQIIKPQLYYNIKKQSITNENHAEFNDQLIDFVGGHNIQLNNIGWEGESGINSYPVVFGANKTWETYATYNFTSNINGNKLHITKVLNSNGFIFSYVKRNNELLNIKEIPSFKVKISGLEGNSTLRYSYIKTEDAKYQTLLDLNNGVHEVPKSLVPTDSIVNNSWIGFTIMPIYEEVREFDCDITIEVIPSNENAICLDGVDDYGKVTGLPIYKDYTVAALRKWLYDDSVTSTETGSIVSKSKVGNGGAFILEQTFNRNPSRSSAFSFGTVNSLMNNDKLNEESFTYQTKYSYNGNPIQAGAGIDSDSMWLGTIRDGDSRFSKLALWSLMLFPYSLSEFLLERQLRKYKAGTLYPDMIEFRPIVKSNIPYSSISYSVNPGEYVTEGSTVTITITLSNASDKLIGVSSNAISDISISGDNGTYEITGKVTKSPQKINIVISSYLTMLDNETLISNETLIKNE